MIKAIIPHLPIEAIYAQKILKLFHLIIASGKAGKLG
jgi:hypothetical protein